MISTSDLIIIFDQYIKGKGSALDDARVRLVLEKFLPEVSTIVRLPHQKPYAHCASGATCPFFNLSHSKDVLVLAVSAISDLGVDVEAVKPRRMQTHIASRYFTQKEQAPELFYRAWNAREAYAKAIGRSIFEVIGHITIEYHHDYALIGNQRSLSHRVDFFAVDQQHVGAVARPITPSSLLMPLKIIHHTMVK